jgi:ribosomal protein L31E
MCVVCLIKEWLWRLGLEKINIKLRVEVLRNAVFNIPSKMKILNYRMSK